MQIKNWVAHLWDCLEIMKSIPDGSIDAIITDPPYWTTACKWDSIIPFEPMWEQLKRIIKPNGAIVLFGSEPFSSALRMSNIKMYKYDWIWEKHKWTGHLLAKKQPLKSHEIISVFWNTINYYPQMREWKYNAERKTIWDGVWWKDSNTVMTINKWDRYPITNLYFPYSSKKDKFHPTQKPVALIEYLIKTYTQEWETVLDFTMWSGTTWVACENTNRKWICIEQDEWYYKIGTDRVLSSNKV